jgi:hypothetical protein
MGTTTNSPSQSSPSNPSQTKPQSNPSPGQKPGQTQNPQGGKSSSDMDPKRDSRRSAQGGTDDIANVGGGKDSMGGKNRS